MFPSSVVHFSSILIVWKMSIEKMKTRKKRRRKEEEDGEAGWGVQGRVQCKSLSLVNVESGANVNKQTTAVTHSYGEMHIDTHTHTRRRRESERRMGKKDGEMAGEDKRWWNVLETDAQTRKNLHIDTSVQKTPNPLHKQTSAPRGRIVSFVNTPVQSHLP